VEDVAGGPSWIIDGNYGRTLERRLARADSVFFLDLPRLLCIARVLRRRVVYSGCSRPSVAEGCPERVTWEFLQWIWTFGKRKRPEVIARLSEVEKEKTVVILRSRREVRAYLARLNSSGIRDGMCS
jgi:adenylate kinase family enzyme